MDKALSKKKRNVVKKRKQLDHDFFKQNQNIYIHRSNSNTFKQKRKELVDKYKKKYKKIGNDLLFVKIKYTIHEAERKQWSNSKIIQNVTKVLREDKKQQDNAMRYVLSF